MNSLSHYFKEKLQESQSSQYTHFSKNDVLSYVEEFGMPDSDKVYNEMLIKKKMMSRCQYRLIMLCL